MLMRRRPRSPSSFSKGGVWVIPSPRIWPMFSLRSASSPNLLALVVLDVRIGGVMRSMLGDDRGEGDLPIHFARINDRDGFFLLGRSQPFDWPDLIGRRLILFSEAPTPWYVLRAFLLERGLDPDRISVVDDLPAPEAAAAFQAGQAE